MEIETQKSAESFLNKLKRGIGFSRPLRVFWIQFRRFFANLKQSSKMQQLFLIF